MEEIYGCIPKSSPRSTNHFPVSMNSLDSQFDAAVLAQQALRLFAALGVHNTLPLAGRSEVHVPQD
jgi:hypothetical protein